MYATMTGSGAALDAARALWAAEPEDDLRPLVEQVCAEAGAWCPDAARRAIRQSRGDVARAVTLVRVWVATLPMIAAEPLAGERVQLVRRISAAYRDVPGGQWLGPSAEFESRLLAWEDDDGPRGEGAADAVAPAEESDSAIEAPTRADVPTVRGLLREFPIASPTSVEDGPDPASVPLTFPTSRATALAHLARAETGALVALASMSLAGRREAVIVESTLGIAAVALPHPRTGAACEVDEIPIASAEVVVDAVVDGRPGLRLGFGATLGGLERRAIAVAVLDATLEESVASGSAAMPLDAPTVLAASDGLATNGFVEHLRLPHYASFTSYVEQVETIAEDE